MDEKDSAAKRLASVPTQAIGQATQLTEETAQKLIHAFEGSQPIQRIRGSQVASAFLGAVGLALFIFGVETAAADLPVLSNPYGSIVVGLVLMAATGLLLRRLAGAE